MGFLENVRLAFTALIANKMRAFLTMLGIIIGISAVITITTIGNSIQQTLSNTFNQFGMNVFYIMLDATPEAYEDENFEWTINPEDQITEDMLQELLQTYPGQFKISMSEAYSKTQIINDNEQVIGGYLYGATNGFAEEMKLKMLDGRFISERDHAERKHTTVVSEIFVNQYFPEGTDPIGETITLILDEGETQDFTIVGVYEYPEAKMGRFEPGTKEIDKETPFFIPYGTVKKLQGMTDITYDYAAILWNTEMGMESAEEHLTDFFEEKYQTNKYWYVYVENEQSILDMVNMVINVITIAISVIAAISLIVGGVGVMNIMLVSIVERTKEIGIRKALGAKNSSIRIQFVTEAIIICLIGGIIGILIGIGNGMLIGGIVSMVMSDPSMQEYTDIISVSVQPSVPAILISIFFSMLIGVFFGYYPANKAAKMNPIDALRYD